LGGRRREDNSWKILCCVPSASTEKKLGKYSAKIHKFKHLKKIVKKICKKLYAKIRFIVKTFHENIEI
jgi:hypothetical protein